MPKVIIVVKETDSQLPTPHIMERMMEVKAEDPDAIMVMIDKTHDDLRPAVRGAEYEVLYETQVPTT